MGAFDGVAKLTKLQLLYQLGFEKFDLVLLYKPFQNNIVATV